MMANIPPSSLCYTLATHTSITNNITYVIPQHEDLKNNIQLVFEIGFHRLSVDSTHVLIFSLSGMIRRMSID